MKKLIALCLMALFLLVFSSSTLATSVVTQPETDDSAAISTWDRTWPVLLAVGSFFLFRFLRSRQHDED